MSRMKDHLGGSFGAPLGYGRSGRAGWTDVSSRRPCPVCGQDSWCQVRADGSIVLCKRVEGDTTKENRDGIPYHVHHLTGAPRAAWAAAYVPTPTKDRAAVEVCDRAYRVVLRELRLDAVDRRGLLDRGLSAEAIEAGGYRTLPREERHRLALCVLDAVGEDLALSVPGVYWKTEGKRGWWTFGGAVGLVIPVRDADGRVVALKIRAREPGEGSKYTSVSSAKHGGAPAATVVHVPLAATHPRMLLLHRLVITEGELKADVATHLSGLPVVSVPGVGSWALGVEFARAWAATVVDVAFDMDADKNRHVARAIRETVSALRAAGIRPVLRRWDPRFKGVDDYFAAKKRGEV